VTLFEAERLGDEGVDERDGLGDLVLARADRDDVGVVVLPGELSGAQVPDECRAHAPDLVGRDLLAVARTAEDDAESLDAGILIAHDGLRGVDAERRVIVERVIRGGAVVGDLVALLAQVRLQLLAQLEAGVVGGDMDAHEKSA
jgi:hypothetical protein